MTLEEMEQYMRYGQEKSVVVDCRTAHGHVRTITVHDDLRVDIEFQNYGYPGNSFAMRTWGAN